MRFKEIQEGMVWTNPDLQCSFVDEKTVLLYNSSPKITKWTNLMRANEFLKEQEHKVNINVTPGIKKLHQVMNTNGFEVRIVGGAVRDLVLGKNPKDIDMATNATPDEMIEIFNKNNIRYEPTGLQHGTLTVIINNDIIEITTLRVDTEQDGRHAVVKFTRDWEVDAERRDLTFNAMSLGLDGTLYDYFNGVQDLKNGIARFVGDPDKRLKEDYLRILRYFRFQGRMSKPNWDMHTLEVIKNNSKGLKTISGERIWAELNKILSGEHVIEILLKMKQTNVSDSINLNLNRIHELKKVQTYTKSHLVALATLMNNTNELNELNSKWKFSSYEFNAMLFLIKNRDTKFNELIAKKMLVNKVPLEYVLLLSYARGDKNLVNVLKNWKLPEFPVTGKDLLTLGYKQGPEMGKILTNLRKKWEDSEFKLDKSNLLNMLTNQ